MKLGRFLEFVEHMCNDEVIGAGVLSIRVYRRFEGSWYDESAPLAGVDELKVLLEQTLASGTHWRKSNESCAYFPIDTLDAVVSAEFINKPSKRTRQKFFANILDACTRSSNAYDATHDPLTDLYNKAGFDRELMTAIERCMTADMSTDESEGLLPHFSLVLIAIDLDFFKQINDSHGHLYGDMVLRALAIRLERACDSIRAQRSKGFRTGCARPSGEEFYVVLSGRISPDDEMPLAEQIRSAIADQPLPNDAEWELVMRDAAADSAILPHASERRVTASLGIASMHNATVGVPKLAAEELKRQADLALYRAKAAGRNRSVRYSEILTSYGRVLEYHDDTDIVAIDIGRQVKVCPGQEFFIYHPSFTGAEPFVFRDGRTERKLGVYPRLPSGRAEVFNVQSEIAFAYVREKRGSGRFPAGSLLELIPAGSIHHLVREEWWRQEPHDLTSVDRQHIQDELKRSAGAHGDVTVAVISIQNEPELLESRGPAFINKVLAELYRELRRKLSPRDIIAQIASGKLAVLRKRDDNDEMMSLLVELLLAKKAEYNGVPLIVAGVYNHAKVRAKDVTWDRSEYNISYGLDYALLAAEVVEDDNRAVYLFTRNVPQKLLYKWRRDGAYAQVLKDGDGLAKLGIDNAFVQNQMALAYFALGEKEKALSKAESATQLHPGDPIIKANCALLMFAN